MSQDAIPTATVVSVGPPAASLEGAKRAASKLKVTTDPPTYEELLKIRDDVVLAPESLDLDPVGASADELTRVAELRCAAILRDSAQFWRNVSPLVRRRTAILALQGVGAPEADLAHHFDRATLLRFLRARPTVAKSAQMFVAMCAWYREYKPFEQANIQRDALRAGTSAEARVAHAYMPAGFHGLDKRGLPVYYGRYGVYDFAGVAREATFEVLMQAAMSTQLSSMAMNNAVSRARGKEYFTNVIVLDLNDVGVSMLKSAIPVFLKFVKVRVVNTRVRARVSRQRSPLPSAAQVLDDYYPERMAVAFVVNCPGFFMTLYRWLVAPFLSADTKSKTRIFGKSDDHLAAIGEYVDRDQVCDWLGGGLKGWPYGDGGWVPHDAKEKVGGAAKAA